MRLRRLRRRAASAQCAEKGAGKNRLSGRPPEIPDELVSLTVGETPTLPLWCPNCGAERATFELRDGALLPAAVPIVGNGRVYVMAIAHEGDCPAVAGLEGVQL
jgi:hypothetical protein